MLSIFTLYRKNFWGIIKEEIIYADDPDRFNCLKPSEIRLQVKTEKEFLMEPSANKLLLKPLSSLEKCFLDENILFKPATDRFTVFRGQPLTFQVAVSTADVGKKEKYRLSVSAAGPLAGSVSFRVAVSVPVHYPTCPLENPAPYLRTTPGLYPDLLRPLHYNGQLTVPVGQTQVLFVRADLPDTLEAGEYPLTVSVGEDSVTVTVRVLSHTLPPQKLIHTEWFYSDCLADFYHTEPFSPEHWRILERFIRTAVKNGINMILTPIFTPELDTYIGGERTTTQLVRIRVTAPGQYAFDFSLLDRWIDLCLSCGVEYFEMAHLFSQWGAAAAPKVVAEVEGEVRRIFGWETDALGADYECFLSQFLPALVAFLQKKGVDQKTFFHISDEPHGKHLEHYLACKNLVAGYIGDLPLIDAMSDYAFYESGVMQKPIPVIYHADPFLAHNVPGLWVYYNGSTTGTYHITGRMIAQRLCDTRALGFQLWQNRIEGFLHWGFNFWNSQDSYHHLDPFLNTDADYFMPSGDAFLVYPGDDGDCWESLRLNAMREAMEDLRMLSLCESVRGRDFTEALLRETAGEPVTFRTLPREDFYGILREKIAAAIEE